VELADEALHDIDPLLAVIDDLAHGIHPQGWVRRMQHNRMREISL
jgi:hypothetical protein